MERSYKIHGKKSKNFAWADTLFSKKIKQWIGIVELKNSLKAI